MSVVETRTYTFTCDWPFPQDVEAAPCPGKLVIHGELKKTAAVERARREGWGISNVPSGPHRGEKSVRCAAHSYAWARRPPGRTLNIWHRKCVEPCGIRCTAKGKTHDRDQSSAA